MRKSFRKFSAIAAGLALSLTLTAPAYAATLGDNGVYEGSDNAITINKVVVVANEGGADAKGLKVAYPAMSFAYTAAGYQPNGATVTDNEGNVAEIKKGLDGALTASASDISIKSGTIVLNANGQEAVNGTITFTVDAAAYKTAGLGAGVYRYAITETADAAALAAKGVVRATTDKVYYLDVYLKNTNDGGLEPGGYVLIDPEDPDDPVTPKSDDKKGGFDDVPVVPVDPKDDPTPDDPRDDYKLNASKGAVDLSSNDHYQTYNTTVTKVIGGTMGDKAHGFAFVASLTNQDLDYSTEVTGNTTASFDQDRTFVEDATGTVNAKLSNGGTLKVWGLSPLATVNFEETNDTESTYTAAVKNASNQLKSNVKLAAGEKLAAYGDAEQVAAVKAASHNTTADVEYTNTLNQISPTGVVLRFAPFVAMMAAGMVLLLGFKSNKAYEEE